MSPIKRQGIRLKILVPLVVLLIFLFGIFILFIYENKTREIEWRADENLKEIDQLFHQKLSDDAGLLKSLMAPVSLDKDIQKAWLERDRDALFKCAQTYFKKFGKEYRLTHFYFFDKGRICFLRVQNSSRYGDKIDRFTLKEAERTQSVSWGLELGPYGTFTLRVVQPWIVGGQLIGYLEFGEEIDHITEELKQALGLEVIVLVKKALIDPVRWEETLRLQGKTNNWKLFSDLVVVANTLPEIPPQVKKFFETHISSTSAEKIRVPFAGRLYRSAITPLRDVEGRDVGLFCILFDDTVSEQALKKLLVMLFVIGGLSSAFLILSFFVYVGRIEKELLDSDRALRESERKIRALFDQTFQLIGLVTPDGTLIEVNRTALEFSGIKESECLGKPFWETPWWTHSRELQDKLKEAVKTALKGEFVRFEATHPAADGSTRIIDFSLKPVKDDQGNILYLVPEGRDITERKKMEETARHLAAIVEYNDDAIIGKTLEGIITSWNTGAEKLYGYTQQEIVGKPIHTLVPSDRPDEVPDILKKIRNGELVEHFETVRVDKSGKKIDVSLTISPIKDNEGRIVGASTIARDITEKKRIDESIKKLFRAVEQSPATVVITDVNGNIEYVNPKFCELTGYSVQEAIGQNPRVLKSGQQHAEVYSELWKTIISGQEWHGEFCNKKKNGEFYWESASISPVRNAQGKVINFVAVKEDITARKALEDALEKQREELKRSNRDLEEFAYVASHDLQEPLRMVASYTQLLEKRYKDKLDDDARTFIQFSVDGAVRMQRLINDLLTYSRVGTRAKAFEKVNCTTVCEQAIKNLENAIARNQAQVTFEPLPEIVGDDVQLTQVFQNLIGNALKFHGKEPPRVHVKAEMKDKAWLFSVKDNGIGIDPQYAERIFVIFQRLHSHEEYEGTGIGLSVCKKIVERHGGRVWFESELGKGTTFYFTIPKK